MASSFITALIIKRNNTVFLGTDLVVYGELQPVPTPGSGGRPDADYWAVPITDGGVVDSFNFVPVSAEVPTAPTVQSFRVFRLITSKAFGNADYWYIRGTVAQYIASSAAAECCTTPVAMPTDLPELAGTQIMCQYNNAVSQLYFGVWGIPTIPAGGRIYAYGYFNNVALTPLSAFGYSTATLLVAAMNSAWSATVGGTFVLANGVVTLTQTAGDGDDAIAINIFPAANSSNPF